MRRISFLSALAILLYAPLASAATLYVDGSCTSSGSGTSLTCGSNGPFKTINEGINVMNPGDTLNIRGAYGSFDGTYNELVRIWGTTTDDLPGKALLNGSAASPYTIRGYGMERPEIRGMVRRTDWTSVGNGVWKRTQAYIDHKEILYEWTNDDYNPWMLFEGSNFTIMGYEAPDSSTPAEGKWSYNSSTHEVFVNPTGSGNPNSDTFVWVPNHRAGFMMTGSYATGSGGSGCPSGYSCPGPLKYINFKQLTIRGANHGILATPHDGGTQKGSFLTFDDITIRGHARFGINISNCSPGCSYNNIDIQDFGRGMSYIGGQQGGGFGMRMFTSDGATYSNITIKHGGNAGQISVDNSVVNCEWCDAPWNDRNHTYYALKSNGFEVKQHVGATATNIDVQDMSNGAIHIDCSQNVTLDGFKALKSAEAIREDQFTLVNGTCPVPGGGQKNITIRNGTIDDCGFGFNPQGCITGDGTFLPQPFTGSDFGLRVYNVVIGHPAVFGISLAMDKSAVWNTTIYGNRNQLYPVNGATDLAPDGILMWGGATNADIRNNIFNIPAFSHSDAIAIKTGVTGLTMNNNLYYTNTNIRWGFSAWKYSSGTNDGTLYASPSAFHAAQPAYETNGLVGNPAFVSSTNQHLTATSSAIGNGANLSTFFTTDRDGITRVLPWEIGAYEYISGSGPAAPSAPGNLRIIP